MKKMLLLAALATASTGASAAEIIQNGSFENPLVPGACCVTVDGEGIPGWTATPNVNVVIGTYGANANLAQDQKQYLDLLGEGSTGSISQTFQTVAGQAYLLRFFYSHNIFGGTTSASANWSLLGSINGGAAGGSISHDTGTTSNLDWREFTYNFVGTGGDAVLSFLHTAGSNNGGIFLDNVTVSAVPEPATWLTMLLGFGFIGYQMRRARRVKAQLRLA